MERNAKGLFSELDKARDDVSMAESMEHIESPSLLARAKQRNGELKRLEEVASRMISALPRERWAAAVNDRFVQGLSAGAVAADMGVSSSTVYSYISQAARWLDANFEFGE